MAIQISLFIENKEGRIRKAIDTLAKAGINIRALSVADTTKYGILRLIVSDSEKATKALENDGFIVKGSEVVVAIMQDKPNGLNSVLALLDDVNINLEYIYAFVGNEPGEGVVAMKVEDPEKAREVFEKNNIKILTKDDIEKI